MRASAGAASKRGRRLLTRAEATSFARPTDESVNRNLTHRPPDYPLERRPSQRQGRFSTTLFLLFLALLPQFTDPNAGWPLSVQIVVLGLVHVASCAVI